MVCIFIKLMNINIKFCTYQFILTLLLQHTLIWQVLKATGAMQFMKVHFRNELLFHEDENHSYVKVSLKIT